MFKNDKNASLKYMNKKCASPCESYTDMVNCKCDPDTQPLPSSLLLPAHDPQRPWWIIEMPRGRLAGRFSLCAGYDLHPSSKLILLFLRSLST